MSFADELRQAPQQKQKDDDARKKQAQMQWEQDWNRFIEQSYNAIKAKCKSFAYQGGKAYTFSSDNLIPNKSDNEEDDDHRNSDSWEKRIRSRTWHYIKPNKSARKCLTKDDLASFTEALKEKLEKDGLTVEISTEPIQTYRYEIEFIKRSESERKFNSFMNFVFSLDDDDDDEGEYKRTLVKDDFKYKFKIAVSWR